MKTLTKALIILIGMVAISFGCNDQENNPSAPVEIRFELLNEAGEPSSTFAEGEDIIFNYRMVNLTDQDLTWYDNNFYEIFNVYQIIPPSEELPSGEEVEIGRPHQGIMVTAIYGRKLLAKNEVVILMTWQGNEEINVFAFNGVTISNLAETNQENVKGSVLYKNNTALPIGKYYVEFRQTINFFQFEDKIVHIKKCFEVF
ncbi:MAG: hypothetical protein ACFCUU_09155 [Cyclobacteriaceae bacterium]